MINLQELIKATILTDQGKLLKPYYKKTWTKDNYLRGYCYIISEVLYHYVDEFKDFYPHMIYVGDETHWYLKNTITGEIADYSAGQYSDQIDYNKGTKRAFFKGKHQTKRGWISKNGMLFYKKIKLVYQ